MCWKDAMAEELDAIKKTIHGTLFLYHQQLIGSKWVYCVKLKSDGSFDR